MSRILYPELAAQLAETCRRGDFGDRLPPVRELCRRYRVSRNTVTLAMRLLTMRGALEPTPRGTWIHPDKMPSPPHRTICVVSKVPLPRFQRDPLFKRLGECAAASGYKVIAGNHPAQLIDAVDGFIFVYSALQVEFGRELQRRGIPFAVGNRCPDDYRMSWADWDHSHEFNDIIGGLVREGSRSIAIHMMPAVNFQSIIEDFIHVKHEYQLFNRQLDDFLRHTAVDADEFIRRMLELPELPDTLIGMDPILPRLQQALARYAPELLHSADGAPPRMRLVLLQLRTPAEHRGEREYRKLAGRLWRLLQRALADPWCEPRHYWLRPAFRTRNAPPPPPDYRSAPSPDSAFS